MTDIVASAVCLLQAALPAEPIEDLGMAAEQLDPVIDGGKALAVGSKRPASSGAVRRAESTHIVVLHSSVLGHGDLAVLLSIVSTRIWLLASILLLHHEITRWRLAGRDIAASPLQTRDPNQPGNAGAQPSGKRRRTGEVA
jgi:hypothetical protein